MKIGEGKGTKVREQQERRKKGRENTDSVFGRLGRVEGSGGGHSTFALTFSAAARRRRRRRTWQRPCLPPSERPAAAAGGRRRRRGRRGGEGGSRWRRCSWSTCPCRQVSHHRRRRPVVEEGAGAEGAEAAEGVWMRFRLGEEEGKRTLRGEGEGPSREGGGRRWWWMERRRRTWCPGSGRRGSGRGPSWHRR